MHRPHANLVVMHARGSTLPRGDDRNVGRINTRALSDLLKAHVFLETESASNVGFYEHFGFEVLDEVSAAGLDLPVWLMLRPPGSPGP